MSEDDKPELKFAEDGEAAAGFTAKAIENAEKDHPISHIEPLLELSDYDQGYKDACKRYPYILNAAVSFILESDNYKIACYQVAFALGLGLCTGQSMEAAAIRLGITRACISKGATMFVDAMNLPPSHYMKSTLARLTYSEARLDRVKRKRNKPKEK